MQVLPPNYGHCSSQYYAALHCVGLVCCVCVFNVLQIKVSWHELSSADAVTAMTTPVSLQPWSKQIFTFI